MYTFEFTCVALARLLLAPSGVTAAMQDGFASCYGDYQASLPDNNVACGYGSFIAGEDFTYTTAICSTWAHSVCGSCYAVKCHSGKTPNMGCTDTTTYVRVIDSLGNTCGSGTSNHVFDLNDVPFSAIVTEGGSPGTCSGEVYVKYEAVSCSDSAVGIVSGGLKVGIMPQQSDPWCPPFWFSNVGGAGALYKVEVSSDNGNTWNAYRRNSGNGGRWDCEDNGGAGTYLGKSVSFKMELCSLSDLPGSCTSSGQALTLMDALPSDWCVNGASPCDANSWQASQNFDSDAQTMSPAASSLAPSLVPTEPPPTVDGSVFGSGPSVVIGLLAALMFL